MKCSPLILLLSFLIGCSSVPKYAKTVSGDGHGAFMIELDSAGGMSEKEMRSALMTEAAHQTIDSGNLYLRVEQIATDSSIAFRQHTTVDPARARPDMTPLNPVDRMDTTVSASRRRVGSIRFTAWREKPSTGEVYEASRLLDSLRL